MDPAPKGPIVVCGPARGGTTATAEMLNRHPEIQLTGEVPANRLPAMRQLIEQVGTFHGTGWNEKRRSEVLRSLWYAAAQIAVTPGRRWGMKTPFAELESQLLDPLVAPTYVYALRRGDRVFQSRLRMGWVTRNPEKVIARYKRSLRRFERLRARGVAHLVQLDLVDGPEDRRRVATELFAFVGEEPGDKILDEIAESTTRVSNPTSKPGEVPELPAEWDRLLSADDEYLELMKKFGYADYAEALSPS